MSVDKLNHTGQNPEQYRTPKKLTYDHEKRVIAVDEIPLPSPIDFDSANILTWLNPSAKVIIQKEETPIISIFGRNNTDLPEKGLAYHAVDPNELPLPSGDNTDVQAINDRSLYEQHGFPSLRNVLIELNILKEEHGLDPIQMDLLINPESSGIQEVKIDALEHDFYNND